MQSRSVGTGLARGLCLKLALIGLLAADAAIGANAQLILEVLPASQTATSTSQVFTYSLDLTTPTPITDVGGFSTNIYIDTSVINFVPTSTSSSFPAFVPATGLPFTLQAGNTVETGTGGTGIGTPSATGNIMFVSYSIGVAAGGITIPGGSAYELGTFQVTDIALPLPGGTQITVAPVGLSVQSQSQVFDYENPNQQDLTGVGAPALLMGPVPSTPAPPAWPVLGVGQAGLLALARIRAIRRGRRV
jgi:hypothetical protein